MSSVHKYDDADYHNGDEIFEEKNLPLENAGTHIGFFLSWVVMREMESEDLKQSAQVAIQKVRRREMSGRDLLFTYCDERLNSTDLNDEANSFARAYYDHYLDDYEKAFGSPESVYEIDDTWTNYDAIAAVIDQRYAEYRSGVLNPPAPPRAWWKFWQK